MSANTVYVTGLPSSATRDDVIDFFTRIGHVTSVDMPEPNSGSPVAVVFDKAEDAASAVSISGSDFQEDVSIHIAAHAAPAAAATPATAGSNAGSNDAPHETEAAAASANGGSAAGRGNRRGSRIDRNDMANKIVVSNLASFTDRRQIRDAFSVCGEIDDFALVPFRHIAFIGFTTAEAFEKALQMDGTMLNGAKIGVERRKPSHNASSSSNSGRPGGAPPTIPNRIVVRNVPSNVNKEGLRAFFEPDCGTPTDIFVKPESGIAFVAFRSEAEADKAIAKSGQEYGGNVVRIERREVLICRRCGREGHRGAECRQPYCSECRTVGHSSRECPRRRGGRSGERRRRRSSSSSSDRDRRRRRHRSDSSDRERRRRRHSRSRSPPRRRHSRSRSRSRSPPRSRR